MPSNPPERCRNHRVIIRRRPCHVFAGDILVFLSRDRRNGNRPRLQGKEGCAYRQTGRKRPDCLHAGRPSSRLCQRKLSVYRVLRSDSTRESYLSGRAERAAPTRPGARWQQEPANPEVRSTKTWSLGRESPSARTAGGSGGWKRRRR